MDKVKMRSLLIHAETSLKQAMQRLTDTDSLVRVLFVVDAKGRLLGTVNDGDIRRGIIDGVAFLDPVKNIMCREYTSIKVGHPLLNEHAKKLMINKNIEHIPVLDKAGLIADVISWSDLLGRKESPSKRQHHNQVVIMAGGKGTRLDPFTRILPKPLIPIGEKPVIEVIMERFYRYGFHRFIYTLNYKKEYLKLFLKENNFPYIIDTVEEDEYLGTAGGIALLKGKVTDTFFIANCDSVLDVDFEQVLRWHKDHKAAITVIGCHNEVKIPFGVIQMSGGRLRRIVEKPVHGVIVNTGVYLMEPRVIESIPSKRRYDMNTLIDAVARKEKVAIYPICGGWFDIGRWNEYRDNISLLEQENSGGNPIRKI